jgi:hypothetical protein
MVYKLRAERSKYLNFYISPTEIEAKLGDYFILDEPLWAEFWKPVEASFHDDSDNQNIVTPPDLTVWFTSSNIALNQKAYDALGNILSAHGELLPASCEGIPYWLLHTTTKIGMEFVDLDLSQRIVEEGGYIDMQSLVFKEEELKDLLIFQTEFSGYRNIYCTEKFKALVEAAGLKGLLFSTDLACVNEP